MTATSISSSLGEKQPNGGISKEVFLSADFKAEHITRIVQEGILVAGGIAAILLQVAEPGVGAGVNQHSNFAYRVQDRLRTTMTFVYCMAFGTPEEKRQITDMITRIHTQVSGTLNEGKDKGKKYSALDPGLQMWVAATLYATAITIYERVWGKIDDEAEMGKIYSEYSILACSLQVPPEMWPANRAAFWQYWDHKVATLEITQDAKDVAKDLLYLRKAPAWARIFMPSLRVVTAEFLPERIRNEFGVNSHPRMYKLEEVLVKTFYRPLPLKMRRLPVNFYMRDMRKRLAAHKKVFEKA